MSIILVSATIGEGKDTFYQLFSKNSGKSYENKKFAYKLKQIVALIFGCTVEDLENEEFKNSYLPDIWNTTKKWTYREVLQYFGTELLRDGFNQDVHINAFYADYKPLNKLVYHTGNYSGKCSICFERIWNGDKRQLWCKKCVDKYNAVDQYPNWLVTDCRFPNEFISGAKYEAIKVKIIRSMSPIKWINSKYFNEINFVPDVINTLIGDSSLPNKISKMDFVDYLKDNNLILDPLNDPNWKKLIHPSETGLIPFFKEGKFDYVIHNDGTLEDFENKVKTLIATIEQ